MAFVPLRAPVSSSSAPETRVVYRDPPDLEERLAEARAEGYAAGVEAMRAEMELERAALRAEAAVVPALAASLGTARKEALDAAANDVAALVARLCGRLLGDALVDPAWLVPVIEGVLTRLPSEDEVTVHVPADAEAGVAAMLVGRRRVAVIADPALKAGCRVTTRHAEVDASLAVADDGVARALREWLDGRRRP
jgi:flagellar biosynthesis/type III secretory pathway protein FliH